MRSHHPTLVAVVQRLEELDHMGTPLYQVIAEFRRLRDEAAKQPPELEDAMDAALGRLTVGETVFTHDGQPATVVAEGWDPQHVAAAIVGEAGPETVVKAKTSKGTRKASSKAAKPEQRVQKPAKSDGQAEGQKKAS